MDNRVFDDAATAAADSKNISRFKIAPEERVLSNLFGAEFAAYRSRVRRWL